MRVAYLVTAYNDIPLLNRLIATLTDLDKKVFIHFDKKNAGLLPQVMRHENVVHVREAVDVYWGGHQLTEAIVRLIETALAQGEFDYVHCISGSDLPVRPIEEFERFLATIHPKNVVAARPVDMGLYEDRRRLCTPYRLRERTTASLLVQNLRFVWGAYVAPRPIPASPPIFTGSSWITVTAEAARRIAAAWRTPEIRDFYENTFCADEFFFPTYVAALGDETTICRERVRYLSWNGTASPKTLTIEDAPAIVESGAFFARKFDSVRSRDLIEFLAARVAGGGASS